MTGPLLRLTRVGMRFGARRILADISLDIPPAGLIVLGGPNGGGKTTLLRIMAGLLRPTEGRMERADGLTTGFLPQVRDIDRHFPVTVEQVVLSGLLGDKPIWRPFTPEHRCRAAAMMERMRLGGLDRRGIGELSGGQWQRVLLARAMVGEPRLLLLDEPLNGLDPEGTRAMRNLIVRLNQTLGVTIVVITHEMRVIEQICQRVAVIDQSCIAEIGNVSDVFTHPKSDIAKALILPKSPTENLPPCTGKRLRLVFDGSSSNEPVISRITLECNVPVNILFADTRIVEGSIYGHMVIDLPSDPQQFHNVLRWLEHNHISYLQEV